MRDKICTLIVSTMMCLAVSFVMRALPACAGHGEIIETDDHIYVEYYGDESDVQAGKIMREEEQKREESVARANAEKIIKRQTTAASHEARYKSRREVDE